MTAIAKSGVPSLATALPPQNEQIPGLLAGEAIGGGDIVAIRADGRVYKANLAAGTPDTARGIAAHPASAGEAVTIYRNVRFGYGTGLTPGIDVFLAPTVAGGLDTAGGEDDLPIGFVVDATRIQFTAF